MRLLIALSLTGLIGAAAGAPASGPHARPWSSADTLAVLDSARDELGAGRHWHAAALLAPAYSEGELDEGSSLLYARALAGYRNWAGVRSVLDELRATTSGSLEVAEVAWIWRTLARAREETGDLSGAIEAYARVMDSPGAEDAEALRVRWARVLWQAGRSEEALALIDGSAEPGMGDWLALELVTPAAERGDTAGVRELLARITVPAARERAWRADAVALLAAADSTGAAARYEALLAAGASGGRAAVAWLAVGEARLDAGDTAGAAPAFHSALTSSPTSRAAAAAARHLVDTGAELSVDLARIAARAMDRSGDGRGALIAYDLHVAQSQEGGLDPSASARVERARLMATVPARQGEAVLEFRSLSTHPEVAIGARSLELWAALRRRQGRSADVATLRRWLVERYPGSQAAVDVVFFGADDDHDAQRLAGALGGYARVSEMAPSLDRAGLARMRSGQIHLHTGEVERAAEVFEAYLSDFPEGRRWEEASYWAARSRLAAGDTAAGLSHLTRLQANDPLSYYAILTADLLGQPYELNLPAGRADLPPDWLAPALAAFDRYTRAGLDEGAAALMVALVTRARAEGEVTLFALGEALVERGRSLEGINLGWELRRLGEPWSLRLLRLVYPFPYQEMVAREAREWGVDPLLLAALIRQESAFVADIVSRAGAIGLMQVMPETGRGLARRSGLDGFTEESLETPEVNLHLGSRFLVDMIARYGPELPLVLSAYNAGPSRAERWKGFPEADDPLRFTERIPFSETRGYVKNVTRNQRLYEALYGPATSVGR